MRNPISFWNCEGKETHERPLDLTRSPFLLSLETNVFAAVSYDYQALMFSTSTYDSEVSAGCKSMCRPIGSRNNSCEGVNCCQTTIPSNVHTFTISFQPSGTNTDNGSCKYVFVVDQQWLYVLLYKLCCHSRYGLSSSDPKLEIVLFKRWNFQKWINAS